MMRKIFCERFNEFLVVLRRVKLLWSGEFQVSEFPLLLKKSYGKMIIGTVLSIGAGMGMASLFAGISAIEPLPLVTTIALMSGAGLAATLVPALRAARQDPTSALRFE